MFPEFFCFFLPFFGWQIFHIGGKPADVVHTHLQTVVLNVAVGGNVIEMLGCGKASYRIEYKGKSSKSIRSRCIAGDFGKSEATDIIYEERVNRDKYLELSADNGHNCICCVYV